MVVCDAMVKRAPVRVLRSHPVDPGKYLVLIDGPVAEIEEAMEAGEEAARDAVLDRLLLPYAHDGIVPALLGRGPRPPIEALGIIETHTLAGAIVGLDVALKAAAVQALELRLAAGLGGKGYFVLTGPLYDVEAATEATIEAVGNDAIREIIAQPHPDFLQGIGYRP